MNGLVLEGGAQRGIYTAGVLDVFLDNGIDFDTVIGVSAGALHGSSYVSKQKGRSIEYTLKYCRHKDFMSISSFIRTGNIVGTQFSYRDIPNTLVPFDYDVFESSPTKMYAVCTNVDTGKAEYIECVNLRSNIDILRASASMPFVSQFVEVFGNKYLDGGVSDSIPVKKALEIGCDKTVVVLTQPLGYRKKAPKDFIANTRYRKYPNLANAINMRYKVYNETAQAIEQFENEGTIFVIRPSMKVKIGRMEKDPAVIKQMYELGCNDAKNSMPKLIEYLKK